MEEEKKAEVVKQELMLVREYSAEFLQKILELEKACFPKEWQYDDPPAYFKFFLEHRININLFLKENDKIIGYCLAVPLNEEIKELKKYDPKIEEKENVYYIETIEILPNAQGHGGAKKLLLGVCEEARKRGIYNFAIHARKPNHLDEKVNKIFAGKITLTREIEHWAPALGEPYEYIEWNIK